MKHNILIIEDDSINCLIYKQILKKIDIVLDFAFDGEQGINKFKSEQYKLILLDLGIPKIDGLSVAKLIRDWEITNNISETPIIVVTADNSHETRKKAFELKLNEFLVKPFDFDDFLALVNEYLLRI